MTCDDCGMPCQGACCQHCQRVREREGWPVDDEDADTERDGE